MNNKGNNKNAMPAGRQGFTLFELLVSISIIGIMMALAIVSYSAAQKKARDSKRIQDISTIGKAAEQYYLQSGSNYPGGTSIGNNWTVNSVAILNMFPIDPKNVDSYKYLYTSVDPFSTFCACALLETAGAGNSETDCEYGGEKNYYCISSQQ